MRGPARRPRYVSSRPISINTNVRRSPVRKLFSVLPLIAALFAVGAVHAASPTKVEGTTTVGAATDRGVPSDGPLDQARVEAA